MNIDAIQEDKVVRVVNALAYVKRGRFKVELDEFSKVIESTQVI